MNTIVSASILSADLCRLGEELDRAEKCGCDHIHFDVMDGVFVNNISYGIPVLASVRKHTKMFIDVHLMITDPIRYIDAFADNGADMISFHLEAAPDPAAVISAIKAKGKKAGIAIKPATPVSDVLPYAESADMILIMTVDPGFGGDDNSGFRDIHAGKSCGVCFRIIRTSGTAHCRPQGQKQAQEEAQQHFRKSTQ